VIHGSKGSFIKPKTDVQEAMLAGRKGTGQPDWGTESETEKACCILK
jgi:hypothetical protein